MSLAGTGKLKLTREVRQQLHSIAAGIPRNFEVIKSVAPITGDDLLLTPLNTINGEPVERGVVYLIDCPEYREINHIPKLEAAFQRGGVRGVNAYIDEYAQSISGRNVVVVALDV